MTKELKKKWLDALRSGEYTQGRGRLRYANQYCCLGVLCDVVGYEWKEKEKNCFYSIAGTNWIKNEEIREELGLSQEVQEKCYNMNDGTSGYKKHSFKKIADWLEKNL